MKQKSILIIEDDRAIREMLKHLLEIEGYRITTASNGKEGVDLLKTGIAPSVILLDMMMPVMNGWDFLDFVRTHTATAKIPIVVVSAYSEIAQSVRPQAIVAKPIQLKNLLNAIESSAA